MKLSSIIRTAMIAGVALFSTLSAYAQTQPAPTPRPKMTQEDRQKKHNDQVARDLNLTPEQRTKFEQTDQKYNEKMKSKRAASKEEMGKMRDERIKEHKSFLTKEQAEKYDQMQAKKQAKHEGRKEGKKGGKGKMPKKDRTNGEKAPDNSRTREN